MGEYDNLLNTGNEIVKEVNKAISTGDYSSLGDTIRVQVQDAVKKATENQGQNFQGRASAPRTVTYSSGKVVPMRGRVFSTPFFSSMASKSKGIGKIIAGSIGSFFFGTWGLLFMLGALLNVESTFIPFLVFALLTALNVFLISRGVKDNKLAKAYKKYGNILGNSEYFAVRDLAVAAGEMSDSVLKNIKNMMKKGFLPQARLDSAETTVMLTQRAYDRYLNAEVDRQERERRQRQEEMQGSLQRNQTEQPADGGLSGIMKEGNDYLNQIRKINEAIPGDEMSSKLYQLENIMSRIFSQVEKQPECADDLRKFMNYYLPTTTKLLNAYVDLDKQPEVGNNIAQTKREIEDAIDVINSAFENLLDSLFQDMAWDISSDISVMKTMMAQDGLTEDGLRSALQNSGSETPVAQTATAAQAAPMAAAQAAPASTMQMETAMAQAAQTAQAVAPAAQEQTKVELKF
ncbi:5-bromo-4-chloroindolyl phosphate hydrolysis family protein [Butyrivibrio sp. MB2005]|uniref:5-bromo-4-chloroindolyl phosphate hydrolysis family protein n=1 Tax=Butyrivibrio sp. MB2005 TaxID=1280678 RepID=UPI00040064AA|nr:5-bromo-4-chloroindolyl phosphate hydrolysis family protein [Butyrivibrio sp. MB2005]